MMTLHMVSLPIELKSLRQWSARRNLSRDEGATLHHLLAETFGKSVLQPFRLMVSPGSVSATLYAYTTEDQTTLQQTATETGMPDALAVCDPARLAAKTMPETWTVGRRLAFDLRARPVRRLLRPAGDLPKGAEVDAFLVDAIRAHPEGPPAEGGIDRESIYRQWLEDRLKGAARIAQLRIARIEQNAIMRNGKTLKGPDVTFHGDLEISDGAAFADRLAKGVGRHASYGFGMLLLRPSRR